MVLCPTDLGFSLKTGFDQWNMDGSDSCKFQSEAIRSARDLGSQSIGEKNRKGNLRKPPIRLC
jgi:hypothetical protein